MQRRGALVSLVVAAGVAGVTLTRRSGPEPHRGAFLDPEGLTVGPEGTIYVADEDSHVLSAWSPSGQLLARTRPDPVPLGELTTTGGSLVALGQGRVLAVGAWDLFEAQLGPAGWTLARRLGPFHELEDVAVDEAGRIYLAIEGPRQVHVLDPAGRPLRQLALPEEPEALCIDGARLLVAFAKANYVGVHDRETGAELARIGRRGWLGELDTPDDVQVGPDGLVYVSDQGNHRIQVFEREGRLVRTLGRRGSAPGELDTPEDIAFGPDGLLWVADSGNRRVQALTRLGAPVRVIQ